MPDPHLKHELERLKELRSFAVLDTAPEPQFDDLAVLASQICETQFALVSLVDADRLFFKSHIGTDIAGTPRENMFCDRVVTDNADLLCVEDATKDPRFWDNPLVTGGPCVRFYAGVPLVTSAGLRVGSLCVVDQVPHQLNARQRDALRALGRQVVSQLELRRGLVENVRLCREARYAERRALHDATHDALTGLPNRTLISRQITDRLELSRSIPGPTFSVLFLDVDRFKVINDSLGHAVGDLLLNAIASRLTVILEEDGHQTGPAAVGRFGGDEFVIVLNNPPDTQHIEHVVRRAINAVSKPFHFGGTVVHPSVSVGVAMGPGNYASADDLLRDADAALYEAKAAGRGRFVTFDSRMHDQAVKRLKLESDLSHAVERNELTLHYQPVVSLGSHRPIGVEALVRWHHDGKLVSPADFIPVAEETGLIVPIGRWVMAEAVRQAAEWQQRHPNLPPMRMSVNVSRRQLADEDLIPLVRRLLGHYALDPAMLLLEITESAIMGDADEARHVLSELRGLGVRLAMDDFGTGYSSLSCLHEFEFDVIKVDRSFVANLGNRRESTVLRAVLELAHGLGMKVVAEGIESAQQMAFLAGARCDYGQGYLFARPLVASDAEQFLIRGTEAALSA